MKKVIVMLLVLALGLATEVAKADFTFGTPKNLGLTINTPSADFAPNISADGLKLFFSSTRPSGSGQSDIWVTTRATKEDDWGNPVNLGPTVNSSAWEVGPCVSADGLELYFGSYNRPGGSGDYDLWVTTRETTDDDWGPPVNLGPTVNSSAGEWGQSLSADGLELYFSSQRPGGHGRLDLWVTTRETTNDDWGNPVNLGPTVNSSADDAFPYISPDGLKLFFSDYLFGTSRPGGYGGADIWMTTRATKSDPWGEPVNLGPTINSSFDEDSPNISADGSTLYFDFARPGGDYGDIYQASIIPIVDFNGDGIVDAADMDIMIDNWHTDNSLCDIGPTPLGDGIVDVQDMLVLTEYLTKEKVDVEADIAAIEEVVNQYAVTANAGDFEGWLSLHADDVVKMGPDAPAIFGKEDLRANFAPAFENFDTHCAIYPEETQVDGDMGLARGTYTLSITPKAGGETIDIMKDGKYLTLFKRQADGSWKISHDCYNSNIPPAQ
jgi:uncharacterized protein (TIGR02246 family)